jgi:ligand-binding sensor domain-containing protein/signal transduction histidine kinase
MQIIIFIYRQSNYIPRIILFLILLFLLNPLFYNNLFAQYKNLKFAQFKIEDGVIPIVRCICQDRTGYIWAGTYWGILRYDGYLFKPYLPNYVFHRKSINHKDTAYVSNAIVEAISVDDDGNIWAGTSMGLNKFNPITEKFIHYILNPSMPLSDWSNHVLALCNDRKGNLWIGTGNGLYLFDKKAKTFQRFIHDSTNANTIIHNSVNAVYEDKSGNIWVGTGGGLDKLDSSSKKFIHYWKDSGISDTWGSVYWVLSIFVDRDRLIWLGTQNGLVEFDKAAGSFTLYKNNPNDTASLGNNSVSSICQDKNGFLWLSTAAGLDIFDKRTKKFFHYRSNESDPTSLSTNEITQIIMDRSGTTWIATNGGGLNKCILPSTFLKEYPLESYGNFPRYTNNLIQDLEGKIWTGTDKGLISFDPVKEELKKENFKMSVEALNIDKEGTIWVISGQDNLYYKKNNEPVFKKFRTEKIFNEVIISMRNSRDGNMWLGTSGGQVLKLDIHSGKIEKKLKYDYGITNIYEDKNGSLWLGTNEAGVIRYNQETNSSTRFIADLNDTLTISGNQVYDFCEDGAGNLWVITNSNINKFDKGLQKFEQMFGKDGFNGDGLSMFSDYNGNLWVSTGYGVDKYDPIKKQHILYNDLKLGWMYLTRKGEMYLISTTFFKEKQKLLRINIDSLQNNSFIPPIVITSFKKFEKSSAFGKEVYLNYNENYVSFEFSALSFIKPEENQYAYKMEGIDKDWIFSETRHYASYPNLEPGKYIFRVKGSNNDGVWNEEGTSIAIIISPPWWGTWWFRIGSLIMLFISVGSIIRYLEMKKIKRKIEQLEQERALERERTRISRDMHDEVGSSLSEIAILSELAKKKPEEAAHHIQEISERAAEVIDSVSEIVWAMNPQNDKLDNLIAHTRRYAVKYLGLANISCKFTTPYEIPSSSISAELRRNIFLVVKELLHNVVKHSCASEVMFEVSLLDHNLEIKIADNGKGFSLEQSTGLGNGLINMRKRIEDIGGTFNMESTQDKGTQIEFSVIMYLQPS